ncbi:ABC transporter ATP-binding protein [Photobacterium kasasachensis]|uniref:ABC transporter ATP-binding protein n=1 Tax=Photobacterium kasasachensis TaxID=2910240 RepID=UPI003D0D654A
MSKPKALLTAFINFYHFSSKGVTQALVLMIIQGLTAGFGLLMIIPLLQIIGFDTTTSTANILALKLEELLRLFNLQLNLPFILLLYILIVSTIATLNYYLATSKARLQQAYICSNRQELYEALLCSQWQFIISNRMSDFTHSLTTQVQAIGHAAQLMLTLLSQLVLTIVFITLSLVMSWQMTILATSFAMLLLLLLLPLNRLIYGSGQKQLNGFKAIFSLLTEQLASLKMIKSYASEQQYAEKVLHTSRELELQHVKVIQVNAMIRMIYLIGGGIAFSTLFYIAVNWFAVPYTTLLLLLVIFARLLPLVSSIQSNYQRLLHQLPAFEDVEAMKHRCHAAKEAPFHCKRNTPILNHAIRLENVSYCYPDKQKPVIDNLSLTIKRNQTLALVGPSGAGKSTLTDLLAGLLQPEFGNLYCDDIKLKGEHLLAWRQGVAYVTQEVFLFHDTIRANLCWVAPNADDQKLWEVLKQASAEEFVRQLPEGLNTIVGDRGIRLSGGERQRLALARAILSNPQLLILDEATSALDLDNEMKIKQALQQLHGKMTIIIIAHRPATIQHADALIELEN